MLAIEAIEATRLGRRLFKLFKQSSRRDSQFLRGARRVGVSV